jgi:hypothetical protein
MGTWGEGNFDSDTALDYRHDFDTAHLQPLVREIEAAMAGDPKYLEPDESEAVAVMCRVEILCLFAEHIGCTLPEPDVVARWRDRFLAVWDGWTHHPRLFERAVPTFEVRRKAVIAATWNRLEYHSRRQHDRTPPNG